jgi:hypothetical protein
VVAMGLVNNTSLKNMARRRPAAMHKATFWIPGKQGAPLRAPFLYSGSPDHTPFPESLPLSVPEVSL